MCILVCVFARMQKLDRFGWLFGEAEPSQLKEEEGEGLCFGWHAGWDGAGDAGRGEAIYPFGGPRQHTMEPVALENR